MAKIDNAGDHLHLYGVMLMSNEKVYVGIHNDLFGGMTDTGNIIKDAWVFDLIPETETCEGWTQGGIQALYQKVQDEWDKYGCLASKLPDDLRARHDRIHGDAIKRAKEMGWEPQIFEDE